ncbi:hapless 2 [Cyclospora cayetanensis]|uniref:Hapless 2 n=1 Tax=Cyclospora cayetanensis TaxID=88456 RepID=A0A6P6S2I0_9EIME|nr:hapless 2 [Cyclospora cayetanensis]
MDGARLLSSMTSWRCPQSNRQMRKREVGSSVCLRSSRYNESASYSLTLQRTPRTFIGYLKDFIQSANVLCHALMLFCCLAFLISECLGQGTTSVETVCSNGTSGCTQRLIIDVDVENQDKLQFQWEAGDINGRSPQKSDAGNAGVVITVQKTAVSYSYSLSYIKAVPFNWVEYAHRALLWQVKDGGEAFCSDAWGSKCHDEHGDSGYPISPNTGLPLDGAQGKCCWCPSVWHLWLKNPNRGREPMLKCNFWGLRFGKIPDPYLTKFCPVVEYPWYRMLRVSNARTWFFKVHIGVSWWSPPTPLSLSDDEYKAQCQKKIAEGSYPPNFDCSVRLHTEAGMADVILELSDTTPVARDTIFDVTARLISSDIPETPEPNVKGKYVFVPTAPSTNAWVQESLITEGCSDSDDLANWGVSEEENPDLARLCKSGSPFCNPKSCLRHVLVLDEQNVSVDGSQCDLPGVSLQQWGRDGFCDYAPGSCFAKNLNWFHAYNEAATQAGRDPLYALTYPVGHYPRYYGGLNNTDDAIDTSKAGSFELQRLAFSYPSSHKSRVRIEMNAGLIRWIQSTAPGQIISIAPPAARECDNAQIFGCPLKVYVLNSGSVDATYYLELPYCTEHGTNEPTDKLDPVPAVKRSIPAGTTQAFDLTLRLVAVVQEFDFNCIMKLYDSELNQLDIRTFDLLTGRAQDLPAAVTNPTGEVTVVEPPPDTRNWYQKLMNVVPNDGECDCSFWNILCLPADWNDCWGTLKKTLKIILLVGISIVALVLLWPVAKPLVKVFCKCIAFPFKCMRSVGRHSSRRKTARKQIKKEAKKIAKEHQGANLKAPRAMNSLSPSSSRDSGAADIYMRATAGMNSQATHSSAGYLATSGSSGSRLTPNSEYEDTRSGNEQKGT